MRFECAANASSHFKKRKLGSISRANRPDFDLIFEISLNVCVKALQRCSEFECGVNGNHRNVRYNCKFIVVRLFVCLVLIHFENY